jgi:hypothetical protein
VGDDGLIECLICFGHGIDALLLPCQVGQRSPPRAPAPIRARFRLMHASSAHAGLCAEGLGRKRLVLLLGGERGWFLLLEEVVRSCWKKRVVTHGRRRQHSGLCSGCAEAVLRRNPPLCPICRMYVSEVIRFVQDEPPPAAAGASAVATSDAAAAADAAASLSTAGGCSGVLRAWLSRLSLAAARGWARV